LQKSAHPDLSNCRISHAVTRQFPALANSMHPMQSKALTIPKQKLPELVVATKEGNWREIKTG
jgi:hypothetical protein